MRRKEPSPASWRTSRNSSCSESPLPITRIVHQTLLRNGASRASAWLQAQKHSRRTYDSLPANVFMPVPPAPAALFNSSYDLDEKCGLTNFLPNRKSVLTSGTVVDIHSIGSPTIEIIVYHQQLVSGKPCPDAISGTFGPHLRKYHIPSP